MKTYSGASIFISRIFSIDMFILVQCYISRMRTSNIASQFLREFYLKDKVWGLCLKVLKRWTRAGLLQLLEPELRKFVSPKVVSVGGLGPVDTELVSILKKFNGTLITLDIDSKHNPQILGSIENIEELLFEKEIKPDCIIAFEVMEHVQDPKKAFKSCRAALSQGGLLIISTPWVIPIHDRPNDFLRFTPAGLKLMLNEFENVRILARGNYYDSLVALMLRGLFSGKKTGKLIMVLGIFLSLASRTPKVHEDLECIDSTIGYVALASDGLTS